MTAPLLGHLQELQTASNDSYFKLFLSLMANRITVSQATAGRITTTSSEAIRGSNEGLHSPFLTVTIL